MSDERIVNRVAEKNLIDTIDLSDLCRGEVFVSLSIEPFLYEGIVLKEKHFKLQIQNHQWEQYAGQHVSIHIPDDVIVPAWASLMITSHLHPHARTVAEGSMHLLRTLVYRDKIEAMDISEYTDRRVVIKGCSQDVPESAYLFLVRKLQPVVKVLMYGEACSHVALYRNL